MAAPAAPAARLYGRKRGHALRARQVALLETLLPRLRFDPADGTWPAPGAALWLEVGFGGGEHTEALASDPGRAVIGCEVYQNGIASLLGRLAPEGAAPRLPDNLRLWDADARPLLAALPAAWLDGVCLMFPDPWPKARHAERRFVGPERMAQVARVLKPGGEWRIASDDPTYQGWVGACLAAQTGFQVVGPVMVRPEGWPPTRYEAKALRAGRQAFYWTLIRH